MPTIAHRLPKRVDRTQQRLIIWLLGLVLAVALAIALALSLTGSSGQAIDRSADAGQAAPQAPQGLDGQHGPVPLGGPRVAPNGPTVQAPTPLGGPRP